MPQHTPPTRHHRRQEARRYLEDRLLELKPGEALPSLRDMIQESGLGRLQLESALDTYTQAGVVDRQARRGIFRTARPVPREGLSVIDLVVCTETGEITRGDEFFTEFLVTFADTVSTQGCSLRLHGLADHAPLATLDNYLRQVRATAVVVFAPRTPELVATVERLHLRWAAAFPRIPLNHPRVIQDSPDMTQSQLTHLLGLGHRRIAYMDLVDPQRPALTAMARRESYYRVMAEHGCRVQPAWVTYGGYQERAIFEALDMMFSTVPAPTAVVVADMQLPGVYRFLERRGLGIGTDCSVIATDDLKIAARMEPPATSVCNSRTAAAALILDVLNADDPAADAPPRYVPLALSIRNSTGTVPAA